MHPELLEIAQHYTTSKKRILDIEGKSGVSSLTIRTANDVRHALDHVLIGVTFENEGDDVQAAYHYTQAREHMREYLLNAHQIVAGKALKKSREAIQNARFFSQTSQSKNLHKEAVAHYSLGRETRTADHEAALNHHTQAIELATESRLNVVEASRREKWAFRISILALLTVLLNLLLGIWMILTG